MEILLAEHAGFCFGVKRAVEGVYNLIEQGKKIYTYGPIIHNEEVVKDLESKGVSVIEGENELKAHANEIVIIRAHGIPKRIYELMDDLNIECIDLTCPFVKRIHTIVEDKSKEGYRIVVIGNPNHPEVVGIMGWSEGNAIAIETVSEAENLEINREEKVCIVSQTTFNRKKFKELVEIVENKVYNVNVVDTICNATKERQESAGEIASKVDVMLVVGGRSSSNTQKLYDICVKECPNTYYIQTKDDLKKIDLPMTASLIGITAGASTPNKIIEEVQDYVRIIF